jgi:hypothetical protein
MTESDACSRFLFIHLISSASLRITIHLREITIIYILTIENAFLARCRDATNCLFCMFLKVIEDVCYHIFGVLCGVTNILIFGQCIMRSSSDDFALFQA